MTLVGVGQLAMPLSLTGSIASCLGSDKSPRDARDACPTVYEGSGVNSFHRVQRDNELDWDLHSRQGLYKYIHTGNRRKGLHWRTLPV